MGRKDKQYRKDLRQQAYERLTSMQAFGESKKEAVANGTEKEKIFSFATYSTYWKHTKYFISWIREHYPECTTLKAAKRHVNEWLQSRADQINKNGLHLSAWTIQTEAAALNKLYGIDKADPDRFQPPVRHREDIRRSRISTERDRHFSVTNNDELIKFCRGTGCRRNVLERLEGRDLWSRGEMERRVTSLAKKNYLTEKEKKHMTSLMDALSVFPTQDYFLHHRKDKGGRYRFAPIIGPDKEMIITRLKETGRNERVWHHVHSGADVHAYRADYAARLYKEQARKIEMIPFDRRNRGTGHMYQGDVYICRRDERGKKLDRKAMLACSKGLGHNRIEVVASHYLHGI